MAIKINLETMVATIENRLAETQDDATSREYRKDGFQQLVISDQESYLQEAMQDMLRGVNGRMSAAFSAVQNKENWKMPIEAIVDVDKLTLTAAAICHFTAAETYVKFIEGGKVAIKSPGYYCRCGA